MAIVILGGLISATALNMVVLPALYWLVEQRAPQRSPNVRVAHLDSQSSVLADTRAVLLNFTDHRVRRKRHQSQARLSSCGVIATTTVVSDNQEIPTGMARWAILYGE